MTATAPRSIRSKAAPRKWLMPQPPHVDCEQLHEHSLLHALLAGRGFRRRAEAEAFLDHSASVLPDPGLLPDLDMALDRIDRAVRHGETIAVFGDYDVDGMTSAAIMTLTLQQAMPDPSRLIVRLPTRDEGYGLSRVALQEFADAGVDLLIAVDCASTDEQGVAIARSHGIDVIIIDHHHMTTTGPPGAITVSPARPDGGHFHEMAAAGLTLLVVHALQDLPSFSRFREQGGSGQLVDLAALGLVADVAPLTGYNRQIVREGIRAMRREPRPGLKSLCTVATIDLSTVNSVNIGYGIAPRLNAAGRMADPRLGFELLLAPDQVAAYPLASELDRLNHQRRAETEQVLHDVLTRLDDDPALEAAPILVESSDTWRPGVLGLAAGKLVELLGRPVILLREEGSVAVGSCRSVSGLHIAQLLKRHDALLERHGGHSQAAGLTIRREAIDEFRASLVDDAMLATMALPLEPELRIDAELSVADINLDIARLVMRLSPFGAANPEPVFVVPNVPIVRAEPLGKDNTHLRLVWRGPTGEVRAPFFGAAWRARELSIGCRVDVACTLSVDRWQGVIRPDVKVMDFRVSGDQ
jgi:single-stranded-DNA-specific exonuclease